MREPRVSVILPNYNHALYLDERINSILNQTYQDFELIILDDCSTDNSRDILLQYKDHPNVKCMIFNEQNTGNTFVQWNKGIQLCEGKYIWIAESDDFADTSFLKVMVEALEKHNNATMCLSGSFFVDEKSKIKKRATRDGWKEMGETKEFSGIEYTKQNLWYRNYVYNASMVIFRRDVYDRIDKSYQLLRCGGDWQFWIEVALQGNVLEVRQKLNYFRQHSNKVTSRAIVSGEGVSDVLKIVCFLIANVKQSEYKVKMLKGECYRRIARSKASDQIKGELLKEGMVKLGISKTHYYSSLLNRVFAIFIPLLSTPRRDKLK